MTQIQHHMRPVHGREIIAEVIDGSWNWQQWSATLGVSMSGLTITEKDEAVNHCFRLVQRRDLARYTLGQEWAVEKDSAWSVSNLGAILDVASSEKQLVCSCEDLAEGSSILQGMDTILLVKRFMCSQELSQPPILLLPGARLARLPSTLPEQIVPANQIPCTTAKKFESAALQIEHGPWFMTDGAAYLRAMSKGTVLRPPELKFLAETARTVGVEADVVAGASWYNFAPKPAKEVQVHQAAPPVPDYQAATRAAVAQGRPATRAAESLPCVLQNNDDCDSVPSSQEFISDLLMHKARRLRKRPTAAPANTIKKKTKKAEVDGLFPHLDPPPQPSQPAGECRRCPNAPHGCRHCRPNPNGLGCCKCRNSYIGCKQCRRKRVFEMGAMGA